ncbi:MAG TPA: 2-hydroxyacyl-CoA dehydratase family protein [Candidatus Brocadiia bacterium]|nr:2-hydroxyacyl-CoA dehydratase family protein [Candidatus Brocadiia bacterium]
MTISRQLQYALIKNVAAPLLVKTDAWKSARSFRAKKDKPNPPFGPRLESYIKLKELMLEHYFTGRYADGAVPVAWITSGSPVELLRPFGFHIVYPENHAALCAVRRRAKDLCVHAENEGFCRDLCSYARTDFGSVMSGQTPVGRVPKPDLLVTCTNICQTALAWYKVLARKFNVPLYVFDTPFIYGEGEEHDVDYIVAQFHELIEMCEKVTGRKLDQKQLTYHTQLGCECSKAWGKVLDLCRNRPAPMTTFDAFIYIGPIVAMRGLPECLSFYKFLHDELQDRVSRGIGAIQNERYRLLWDNLPIWFAIRDLSTAFAQGGFNFVCSTYTNAWAETAHHFDPNDVYRSSAKLYSRIILNRDLRNKADLILKLCRDFQCDGAVLHSDRSCKPYSVGQYNLADILNREHGIKTMILEADHGDPRSYSPEQGELRVKAFMETFQ